ncbi:MAG: response regulator transcription factor [Bacteroidales bacterium]|nr:response regulator transcription factor [Bacteroidales bacterium]
MAGGPKPRCNYNYFFAIKKTILSKSAPELTERKAEILPLLADGLSSKVIADRLCLTEQTIKWYRMRLLEKFNTPNTVGVISKAKELGLL